MESNKQTPAPTRGVPVDLGDGKERRLRYSFATRREMITEFGGEKAMQTDLNGEKLCRVLWYGLRESDPTITEPVIESLVDMENITDIVSSMMKALGFKGAAKLEIGGNPPTPPETAAGAEESTSR